MLPFIVPVRTNREKKPVIHFVTEMRVVFTCLRRMGDDIPGVLFLQLPLDLALSAQVGLGYTGNAFTTGR